MGLKDWYTRKFRTLVVGDQRLGDLAAVVSSAIAGETCADGDEDVQLIVVGAFKSTPMSVVVSAMGTTGSVEISIGRRADGGATLSVSDYADKGKKTRPSLGEALEFISEHRYLSGKDHADIGQDKNDELQRALRDWRRLPAEFQQGLLRLLERERTTRFHVLGGEAVLSYEDALWQTSPSNAARWEEHFVVAALLCRKPEAGG